MSTQIYDCSTSWEIVVTNEIVMLLESYIRLVYAIKISRNSGITVQVIMDGERT